MGPQRPLHIVTGAPGAGKSTALAAFLRLEVDFVAFDIDWLIQSASDLAGQDIHFARSKWKAYNSLWIDFLLAVCKNRRSPVLFAPFTPADLDNLVSPWSSGVRWLLLDCPDAILRKRLEVRGACWTESRVRDALSDASYLRSQFLGDVIDTNSNSPTKTATHISNWLSKWDATVR